MAKYIDPRSEAKKAQQKHWERTGQIARARGLISYMINSDASIPSKVKASLLCAEDSLRRAAFSESQNNEFINLNITPKWRKK